MAAWFLPPVSHLEVVLDDGAVAETQEEFVPVGMHRVHLHAVVMGEQLHSRLAHNKQLIIIIIYLMQCHILNYCL